MIILMGNEVEKLMRANEKSEKENSILKKENDSLTNAQQELKAKIKELTENRPKITSGHKVGSVKYVRQDRSKKKSK